jgi:hypothetical protein
MGIRAQYYKDPYHGHCMNQLVLSALHNRLLELALASHKPSPPRELVKLSLSKPSAKVWISEKNLAGEKIIRVSDCTLAEEQLQNDWLDIARAVKKGKFCGEYYDIYCAAFQGVRVPVADQLEIKGAWISHDDRCEYVTPGKQDRHVQLFMFGFS